MRRARPHRSLLACALIAHVAAAQDLYVDGANGDDSNDGLSMATAWKTIQKSFDSASPGSTVWISEGTYVEHPVLHVSGLPGQPITFQNEPGELVSIDGDPILGSTIVTIEDRSHIVIRGLRIQNLIMPDAVGLLIRATPSGGVEDVRIARCPIRWINWTSDPLAIPGPDDNAQPLIVYGEGLDSANAISDLRLDSLNVYENITGFSEAISIDGNVNGFVVNECDVHDNTNIGILAAGGYGVSANVTVDRARNGNITKNRCWNNVSSYATSGGIYLDGAQGVLLMYNRCWGNGYGIEIGCEQDGATEACYVLDNELRSNLIAGLAIGGYDTGTTGVVAQCWVRNNTFFNNDLLNTGSGEVYITKAVNCFFRNNLFSCGEQGVLLTKEDIAPQSNIQFDFDLWHAPDVDPADVEVNWGTSTLTGFGSYLVTSGWDAHGLYADPCFVDPSPIDPDLSISSNSPAIDAGQNGGGFPGETDIVASPRVVNDTVDIGAYEFQIPLTLAGTDRETLGVFPNPTENLIHLSTALPLFHIDLQDVHGSLVRTWRGDPHDLDLRDLAPGIYTLHAVTITGDQLRARLVKR